jgi:putative PIN family toxin of toxin-antitoxin system
MRAVSDTNILIRALIKPTGTVGPVLQRLREGVYTFLYSEAMLNELVDVLGRPHIQRKYGVQDEDVQILLALLLLRGEAVTPIQSLRLCRDPKDDKFLDVAVAGHADAIVTGDDDLLVLGDVVGVPIVTTGRFLTLLSNSE